MNQKKSNTFFSYNEEIADYPLSNYGIVAVKGFVDLLVGIITYVPLSICTNYSMNTYKTIAFVIGEATQTFLFGIDTYLDTVKASLYVVDKTLYEFIVGSNDKFFLPSYEEQQNLSGDNGYNDDNDDIGL